MPNQPRILAHCARRAGALAATINRGRAILAHLLHIAPLFGRAVAGCLAPSGLDDLKATLVLRGLRKARGLGLQDEALRPGRWADLRVEDVCLTGWPTPRKDYRRLPAGGDVGDGDLRLCDRLAADLPVDSIKDAQGFTYGIHRIVSVLEASTIGRDLRQ